MPKRQETLIEGGKKEKEEMFLHILQSHPEGLTFPQLMAVTGESRYFVEKYARKLEEKGKVVIVWKQPGPGREHYSTRVPATRVFPKVEGWEERVEAYKRTTRRTKQRRSTKSALWSKQFRTEEKVPLQFYLEVSLRDRLERIAGEQGTSIAAVVRDAVRKFLVEHEHQTALGVFVSAHQDVQRRMVRIEEGGFTAVHMVRAMMEALYSERYQRMGMDPDKAKWMAEQEVQRQLEEIQDDVKRELLELDAKRVGRPIGSRMLLSLFIPRDLHNALLRGAVNAGYTSYEDYVIVLLEEALKSAGVKV